MKKETRAVIELYHFSDFYALQNAGPEAVLSYGLKANDQSRNYPWMMRPCVWFTSDPEPSVLFMRPPECRLTVEIPVASKLLVSWPKWLKKHHPEIYNAMGSERNRKELSADLGRELSASEMQFWRAWYVYFGDVPLKAIRAVEYADPKRRTEAAAAAS